MEAWAPPHPADPDQAATSLGLQQLSDVPVPAAAMSDKYDDSTSQEMDSDSDFTVFVGPRLKRKLRQMPSPGGFMHWTDNTQQMFTVASLPITETNNLTVVKRKILSEFF